MVKTRDISSDLILNYSITYAFTFNRTWNSRYLYCGASNRNNVFIFSKRIFLNVTCKYNVYLLCNCYFALKMNTVYKCIYMHQRL